VDRPSDDEQKIVHLASGQLHYFASRQRADIIPASGLRSIKSRRPDYDFYRRGITFYCNDYFVIFVTQQVYYLQNVGKTHNIFAYEAVCQYFNKLPVSQQKLRQHIEEVVKVSDEEFNYILSHFKEKKLKKHAVLINGGDYVDQEYFVLKGCLRIYFVDPETGKEFTYQFAVENWWISDREAFTFGTKAKMTIEALEACELLCLTKENREKLLAEIWKYEHYLYIKCNIGYIALQKRMLAMIKGNAKARYENFIKNYPHLINRIPKTYIASYLGVSRETISRLYRS